MVFLGWLRIMSMICMISMVFAWYFPFYFLIPHRELIILQKEDQIGWKSEIKVGAVAPMEPAVYTSDSTAIAIRFHFNQIFV